MPDPQARMHPLTLRFPPALERAFFEATYSTARRHSRLAFLVVTINQAVFNLVLNLPTGEGLLRFETVDDALEAIEDVRSDYSRHAVAARSIAETCFDSDMVLSHLLQRLGATQ